MAKAKATNFRSIITSNEKIRVPHPIYYLRNHEHRFKNRSMDRDGRASRPHATFTKTNYYPEYTIKIGDRKRRPGRLGRLGRNASRSAPEVNQPVASGVIELILPDRSLELKLTPNEDGSQLRATPPLRAPGTYRGSA